MTDSPAVSPATLRKGIRHVPNRPGTWLLVVTLVTAWSAATADDFGCGPINDNNKLVDYNDPADAQGVKIVERGHFNADTEALIRGVSNTDPMGDIGYTLRRVPNHPRALLAMSRYYLRDPTGYQRRRYPNPDCYFTWAIGFVPEDSAVRMVYAIHLHKAGRYDEAEERYLEAIGIHPNSPEAHYNLGLLYTDMERYEDAREHAHSAYRYGYPLPGLKDKLRRNGAWTEADDRLLLSEAQSAASDSQ